MLLIDKIKSISLDYIETENYTEIPYAVVDYSGHSSGDTLYMEQLVALKQKATALGQTNNHINDIMVQLQSELNIYNRIKPIDQIPAQY